MKKSTIIHISITALIVILIIATYLCGFRITYAPELENSWAAVSAVSGFVSAAISGIAIFVAVNVPKRIANKQNSIALFEKRYTCYGIFQKYMTLSNLISAADKPDALQRTISVCLYNCNDILSLKTFHSKIMADQACASAAFFLFSNLPENSEQLMNDLFVYAVHLCTLVESKSVEFTENEKESILSFVSSCDNFKECITSMEKQLILGTNHR